MTTPNQLSPRAAALSTGAKTYETGVPCKQGHIAPRSTRTGTCIQCTAEASKKWLAKHPGKAAEYTAAYRAKNLDAVREADRIKKAELRAAAPKLPRPPSALLTVGRSKWGAFVAEYAGPFDLTRSVYTGMNANVLVRCPVHGDRLMAAKYVIKGAQCVLCAHAAKVGVFRFSLDEVISRFHTVHGNLYDYSQVEYRGQQVPVKIMCATHGTFMQKPEFHWTGSGCPKCFSMLRRGASQRDTLDTFKIKLQKVFGDLIDASNSTYVSSQNDITVVCTAHNTTNISKPNWLLSGNNPCAKCNHMKSRGEEAVYNLMAAYVPNTQWRVQQVLGGKRELDVYLPENRLAIEYCGEFWHSHKDAASEKQNKHKHFQKYADCKALGIRLITLYESEWLEHNYAVRRLLRNAVGKSKGKLMARKCELRKVTTAEARAFYDRYHPQGGAGSGEHYALLWNGKIVACMRFVLGANDRGAGAANRVWTLGRYATRVTVAGAASRLFKAFLQEYNPPEVKSFSDNRFFDGVMYEKLGFVLEANVAPDYQVWHPKLGLRPKSHFQRRLLPTRIADVGADIVFDPKNDQRTESDITYALGARRLYDCGKKRWVWTLPT